MKRSTKPAWQIDELAHAGAEHLDPGYVAIYDRKAGFDPEPDLNLLQDLGLSGESTLVDCGAGTGSLALAAASRCRKVIALDPSPAMATAISRAVAARGIMNLEVVQQGLLTYEHKGLPVDFAFSRNALHHLPDFWKGVALIRIASILRPGGVLRLRDIVFSFEPGEAKPHIEAWLRSAAKRPEVGWTSAELAAHVRDEYSTFAWLLEPMLVHAGFTIEAATYTESRVYAAYVCRRG